MNKDIRFYDTCSLLICGEGLFNNDEKFIVSSITFQELERIKTANNKDSDIKYSARLLLHLFETHPDMYEVVIHQTDFEEVVKLDTKYISEWSFMLDIKILFKTVLIVLGQKGSM